MFLVLTTLSTHNEDHVVVGPNGQGHVDCIGTCSDAHCIFGLKRYHGVILSRHQILA